MDLEFLKYLILQLLLLLGSFLYLYRQTFTLEYEQWSQEEVFDYTEKKGLAMNGLDFKRNIRSVSGNPMLDLVQQTETSEGLRSVCYPYLWKQ
ncbi:hypothetical protein N7471_005086 [Penicillium samsonianum]|uniref:uncharacterized protein n=1 Tax=Penicillium samsonianum TaxID=1882272 RepID=UPI002546A15B|nr:uncharacterized protein N7471_005086 [Penicillium samsonianum]KAJ6138600.1 hypothetical protein N7471_005086 [Penicillium samsonianum]